MEVTQVTHVSWQTRVWQSAALVGLISGIAILARLPGWLDHKEELAEGRLPQIETLNEAHELTLEVAVAPHGEAALKTAPGMEILLGVGDVLDIAMHNRSGQAVYVAVLSVDATNAVHWWVPDTTTLQHAHTVEAKVDDHAQPLAHVPVPEGTPSGRLDIIGMFFSESVPVAQVVDALRDGGINALRNLQNVIAVDTVPAHFRGAVAVDVTK